jgi:hypothetical protein
MNPESSTPTHEYQNKRPIWRDPTSYLMAFVALAPGIVALLDGLKLPDGSWQGLGVAVIGFALKQGLVYASRNISSALVEASKEKAATANTLPDLKSVAGGLISGAVASQFPSIVPFGGFSEIETNDDINLELPRTASQEDDDLEDADSE